MEAPSAETTKNPLPSPVSSRDGAPDRDLKPPAEVAEPPSAPAQSSNGGSEEGEVATGEGDDEGADNELSDDDDNDALLHENGVDSMSEYWKPPLAHRRKKRTRRLLQSKAYAELVEDRIVDLEEQVRKLRRDPPPRPPKNDAHGEYLLQYDICVLKWVDFDPGKGTIKAYYNPKPATEWVHSREIDPGPKYIIEILNEEPQYDSFIKTTRNSFAGDDRGKRSTNDAPTVPQDSSPCFDPHRIRIRSKLLLKVLEELTSCRTVLGPYKDRLIFLRPFKLLILYEKEIRKCLEDMKAKHDEQGTGSKPEDNLVEETESQEAMKQLRLLYDAMVTYLARPIKLQHSLSDYARTGRMRVAFHDLWYIFKPGYEVISVGMLQEQLYRVMRTTGGRDLRDAQTTRPIGLYAFEKLKDQGYAEGAFVIECFYMDFDGVHFGPVNKTFHIRQYDGERSIESLPIIPVQCRKDIDDMRDRLLKRGKEFANLSSPKAPAHRKYKGLTLDRNQEQVESEVIIDFELAYLRKKDSKPELGLEGRLVDDDRRELQGFLLSGVQCGNPGCCGNDAMFSDYEVDDRERRQFAENNKRLLELVPPSSSLTDDQLVLLPPQVYGFVLRTRRWATLAIDLLAVPEYGDGWSNLVVEPFIKDQVLALVENHHGPQDSQPRPDGALASVDLVQGKGKGLIILLHGEPGVGKTSTAECVAAHTKRPLFPITCGDIGDTAETVEANLEKNFQLAHKWGCVLLLDEADIFLSARDENIQRNAIVSVFLRSLEYYSGILFLTTNRVGQMDRAFKSRIHLSLLYKKLNRKRTLLIWKNNIKRIQRQFDDEGKKIRWRREDILDFARGHYKELKESPDLVVWNGRQIRNAFQTAIAIATYEANKESANSKRPVEPVLDSEGFRKVAKSAEQFEKYLKKVTRESDPEFARSMLLREDDYSSSSSEDSDEEEDQRSKKKKKEKKKKRKAAEREKRRKAKGKRKNDDSDGSNSDEEEDEKEASDGESSDSNTGRSGGRRKKT